MATEFNLYLAEQEWRDDLDPQCFASRTARYGPFLFQRSGHLPGRQRFIELIGAPPATHQTLNADAKIARLLPGVSFTKAQIKSHIDNGLEAVYTEAQLAALVAKLEAIGFNMEWAKGNATVRDLFRRISRHLYHAQRAEGRGGAIKALHGYDLSMQVRDIPDAERDELKAMFQEAALDTSWIDGRTTVRQILRWLHMNTIFPPLQHFGIGEL